MKVKSNIPYVYLKSFERLQEILDSTSDFDQVDDVPNSDKLT